MGCGGIKKKTDAIKHRGCPIAPAYSSSGFPASAGLPVI
jgi:hypothetical protein